MIIMKLKVLGLVFLLLACAMADDTSDNLAKEGEEVNMKKDFSIFSSMMNIFNPTSPREEKNSEEEPPKEKTDDN